MLVEAGVQLEDDAEKDKETKVLGN